MESVWWFGAALALGLIEIFTLDLTFAMLAGGALAAGIASMLGAPLWLSILIFCATSVVLLASLRPWLLKSLRMQGVLKETNVAALPGRSAITLTVVTERAGRVKLNGEVWSARTEDDGADIPEDSEVTVVAIKGATAIVVPEKE
jgi:membrane protein implicated in regulation of membrane protease activity